MATTPKKEQLTIDTGAVEYDLCDLYGETIGSIKFIPSDMGIARRADEVIENINKASERYAASDKTIEDMAAYSDEIKAQYDFWFGGPVSEGLFAKCDPFTLTGDNEVYFEKVLEMLASKIESTTKVRITKRLKKMEKYTSKYNK